MKKVLMSAVFCTALGLTSQAQTSKAKSNFSIGPSAGIGWTSLSNVNNSKFKLGGNFGLSSVYSASEHFGLGLDVKYSMEGAKAEGLDYDLNYVRVPLKAIYFFNKYGSSLRPKLFAGPSFGFLNLAKQNDVDVKSSVESVDVALILGGGFNFRIDKETWLNLDLTYSNGLKDTYKATAYDNQKRNTRNLFLNLGVNFGL